MRKLLAVTLACVLFLSSVGLWLGLSAEAAAPKERHPMIHRALHELREARKDLEKAAHDYGGHRVAAIKDIDRAINQLKIALRYDKR